MKIGKMLGSLMEKTTEPIEETPTSSEKSAYPFETVEYEIACYVGGVLKITPHQTLTSYYRVNASTNSHTQVDCKQRLYDLFFGPNRIKCFFMRDNGMDHMIPIDNLDYIKILRKEISLYNVNDKMEMVGDPICSLATGNDNVTTEVCKD